MKRRNVIYERARFNLRKQEEGKTVAAFINDLYVLVEHCEYGALQDEMVRDRLVVGLRDSKLSEKLQLDPSLALDTAVMMTHQSESVHMQQTQWRKEDKEKNQLLVDSMESKRKHFNGNKRYATPRKHAPTLQSKCTRCGRSPSHDVKSCPAKEAVCRGCGKRGHYKRVCKSVSSNRVEHRGE